ncbi:hypothetical protein HBH98_179850 [Parastagonospora nodorum]|nr:hypothetical protein HBH98_179850 [Parastagonospora nodorum]KAH4385126.1 hypothetical protein HBH97_074120 [Parastagonospora nodorum]KAH4398903.1 hypothetical protein HBH99_106230 [Parastagonospora nodorum]
MSDFSDAIAAAQADSSKRQHNGAQGSLTAHVSQDGSSINDFARSYAPGWTPPCPITREDVALKSLKTQWNKFDTRTPAWDGYRSKRPVMVADLHDFEIYICPDSKSRSYELLGLHHLEVPRSKKMLFDGFLCMSGVKHYVEGVPLNDFSIEGYGDSDDPTTATYVQSASAMKDPAYDIWYRLNEPTPAYARHHLPFLWVAQLAKHVLDFLDEQTRGSVGLEHFRSAFQPWLTARFIRQTTFDEWYHALHDRRDFRVCINAYIDFLYQQAYNLPNSRSLLAHPLWADCMTGGLVQVEPQERIAKSTLATPDVYACFKHMYFGKVICPIALSKGVKAQQQQRSADMGFIAAATGPETTPTLHPYVQALVQVGDVVAFDPDRADKQKWRNADWEWLLHVTDVELTQNGAQRLFGLYLYRPRETNIFIAQYPRQNELFFSDNCNCDDGALLSTHIKGRYDVAWSPTTIPSSAFFVRQTYITQDSAFTTFTEGHKICECKKQPSKELKSYTRGESVYITKLLGDKKVLEPVVFHQLQEDTAHVIVRCFARLGRDLKEQATRVRKGIIAVNELVLTDTYESVAASRIERKCHLRFVSKNDILNDQIPFPYNRKGAGDYWFFSMGLSTKDGTPRLLYLARSPYYFKNGCEIGTETTTKLVGMSLFSGGGNLDRGIEEGGAVDVQTVVEWDAAAIHTQRANARNPTTQQFFCGSVDDHLSMAIAGSDDQLVPYIGCVNIILAGSPCPGFSTLQQNFTSPQSIKNASHITTICSYVDIYRPEYAILENVVSMADTRKGFEDQNVLSQLVAFFVSLGYQVNQYIMDAWTFGSCQRRSRLILTIAAPGLDMIRQPLHTHSLPPDDTAARSLGTLPNGQRFGGREYYPTPFTHFSANTATSDLPDIGNGNVQTCISHPSHRVSAQPSRKERALLDLIPHIPPGCGYREAYNQGIIPLVLQKPGKESYRAYQRIRKAALIPTITTGLSIQDSRNGATVHWQQNRPITIMEARRTQGYLDHEPIIGSLSAQYRIVGNGVDRQVAFALGRAIRQAVIANMQRGLGSSTFRAPTLVDVENDDDHFSDTASIHSGIFMNVPTPRNSEAHTTNASAVSSKCSRRIIGSTDGDVSDETSVPGILGLDGASDARDTPLTAPRPNTSGILSRVSTTIANSIKGLADRSLRYQSTSETSVISTPSPFKRSHDESLDESSNFTTESSDCTRKQIKLSNHTQSDSYKSAETSRNTWRRDRSLSKARYTRHSGLEVAFTPKQWNKRPESEDSTRK